MTDSPSDSTLVTTEQLYREISFLRDLHDTRFAVLEKAVETIPADIIALHDRAMRDVDLRYQQRYEASEKALQAAMAAAKEAVAAAMAASEKAIDKAEAAQKVHNATQNEWRATINDLTKTVAERARLETETMVGALRTTTDISLNALRDRVDGLTTRLDRIAGRDTQSSSSTSTFLAVAAVLVSLVVGGFAIVSSLTRKDPERVLPSPPPSAQ